MNEQQLLEALTTVKTSITTVNQNLTDTAANLTEATTEILAKLAELRNFELSPEVAAIVADLTTATNTVVDATTTIGSQSRTLADIVPNPD